MTNEQKVKELTQYIIDMVEENEEPAELFMEVFTELKKFTIQVNNMGHRDGYEMAVKHLEVCSKLESPLGDIVEMMKISQRAL